MHISKSHIIVLALIVLVSGCRQPGIDPDEPIDIGEISFLFANDDGQLRILHTNYTDDQDTLYVIRRFTTLGIDDAAYGVVDTRKKGTYDWGVFGPNQQPRGVSITWRENTLRPTHKTMWERQYVEIGSFQRLRRMGFYSEINQRTQDLRQWNYYRGANSVSFIDDRHFLALYTDKYDPNSGAPKPHLPIGDRKTFLLLYDINAPRPNQPEIITTFYSHDYMDRFPSTTNWIHSVRGAEVKGSANGEFFIVWTRIFNTWGSSPWVLRFDGTPAYNPVPLGNQVYDRAPGQEAFALDVHPQRDSLLVVSDVNDQYRSTMVLRVPQADRRAYMDILASLPFEESLPENPNFRQGLVRSDSAWALKFNQSGDRVAIIQAINEGVTPNVVIWNWQEGTHRRYEISNGNYSFDSFATPGWDIHAEDDIFYFFAGDSQSQIAKLHYINADDPNQTTSRLILWDDIDYVDMPRELPLRSVKELKQRKPY